MSSSAGVLEALQTKQTINDLVEELIETIELHCENPVILIGHSWGAWLAYLVAAEQPELVSKLVLVGSGPFETDYAREIGSMIEQADAYSLRSIENKEYRIEVKGDMFRSVWSEAEKLRTSGELLELASNIMCDVIVVHGDYDPHPIDGVIKPLASKIKGLKTIIIEKCGHYPWKETYAHDKFFDVMNEILYRIIH